MAFCENVERYYFRRRELNFHVLYYLYQLFQYLKTPDDFEEMDSDLQNGFGKQQKLKIFSKSSLNLKDFFTRILPDVANFLSEILKDSNIEDKIKNAKLPEEIIS